MDFLKTIRARSVLPKLMTALRGVAPSLFLMGALLGCSRDFESPLLASTTAKPDSTPPVITVGTTDTAKPVVIVPAKPVPIEAFAAADMRMVAGETSPATVAVLPANASSPLYEMISSKPAVAEIRAEGVFGKSAGTASITIRALDGSERTGGFQVIVDSLPVICILSPCLCLEKDKGNGNGKGKCEEDLEED